jgi:hypothetical protein
MNRFFCVLAIACVFAAAVVGAALAAAGPSGKGNGGPPQTITATCSIAGTVTVRATSGASARVSTSNTHYVLLKFMGTFTPTHGTPTSFTKLYGQKEGLESSVQTCTGSQTSPMGTFSFTAWVVKTPAR